MVAGCALAQEGREAYREAFRSWRQADPGLERDAATAGAALRARAEKVAQEATKYAAARKAFLVCSKEQWTPAGYRWKRWRRPLAPVIPMMGGRSAEKR